MSAGFFNTGEKSQTSDKASSYDVLFEGKLLGAKQVTLDEQKLKGKTHFMISVKFYSHRTSFTVPIEDYFAHTSKNSASNDTLSIMCPMSAWFVHNNRSEIGTFEIAYTQRTRVFRVLSAFYRHSDNWKRVNSRNNNDQYFVAKIEAIRF